MKEPTWATELFLQVCEDEGRSKKPKIDWGYSKTRRGTSGHYNPWRKKIRVLSGYVGNDHKQVFLHEICHWLTQPRGWKRAGRRTWHGKRFYLKLHELLTRYDCLTTEYQVREANYMKRSVNYL
jgi:hypothetical protein